MEQIAFLTYGDVVESGACLDGTIDACKKAGNVFFGNVDEMLDVFYGQKEYVLKAAKLNGVGNGNGYGYGDGYGYGVGNGDGDGYGNGDGYGDGNGYGNGYGDGNGDGNGDGEI
jgi:hypothetical protein